jgi:cytochrome b6-f complex iron-sulfur subunit
MSATRSNARMIPPTRRDTLKVLTTYLLGTAGAFGLAGVLRFLSFETEPQRQTEFDLGLADSYSPNKRMVFPDVPALVVRREDGFQAYGLVCTHLGCTIEEVAEGFLCPCHGSRYDREGTIVRGPALKSLQRLRTEISTDGRLIVHTD